MGLQIDLHQHIRVQDGFSGLIFGFEELTPIPIAFFADASKTGNRIKRSQAMPNAILYVKFSQKKTHQVPFCTETRGSSITLDISRMGLDESHCVRTGKIVPEKPLCKWMAYPKQVPRT